jgi:tetratricopeptide (TPR) repeat protein
MGRFDEAIAECRALIEQSPRSLFARDLLSAAYLQRGMLDHALRTTDEMIVLDPSDPVSHFKRGVLLQQKGQTVRAVQAFMRVLDMDSEGEAADESRAALEMLDCSQLRQIFTLAMDDWAFRWRLRHNGQEAITSRGFLLSERGLAALAQMHFDEFPQTPAGWRQYHYH